MCGIIGYIGKNKAQPILLDGLKRMEYRGYDSAGISVMHKDKIVTLKSVGKILNLENKINNSRLNSHQKLNFQQGKIGLAHTRWATHGEPSEKNAHPQKDCSGNIFIVHNGIIENYQELKKQLIKKGHLFRSDTDTEVIAHLIEEFNKKENFKTAVLKTLNSIKGTYGLAIINKKEPDKIIAARLGSPLLLGLGDKEYIIASDPAAIIRQTNKVIYLKDGEIAIIKNNDYEIISLKNKFTQHKIHQIDWTEDKIEKQGYDHFMLKEIFEQPKTIKDAIRGRLIVKDGNAKLGGLENVAHQLKTIEKIIIISCGTSYYAGLVGEYMLEEYADIPVEVEYASEFRYRKPILDSRTIVLAIS
ncbi:MAG: glutamine--fructose-6-phosphate transaminase (isomerizing), partial [Xanthomonadaceae bacterium]|nr:glutamine--fructose-6-phosphate transaminase (isomerizing) [Rhodospirillaceae bacterium]NIA17814.1 glutamine--fructose-6-phosphate transaminase (isomerizing) [Xanthomonadaceae bacterium]